VLGSGGAVTAPLSSAGRLPDLSQTRMLPQITLALTSGSEPDHRLGGRSGDEGGDGPLQPVGRWRESIWVFRHRARSPTEVQDPAPRLPGRSQSRGGSRGFGDAPLKHDPQHEDVPRAEGVADVPVDPGV
jgi:hypothetical protein